MPALCKLAPLTSLDLQMNFLADKAVGALATGLSGLPGPLPQPSANARETDGGWKRFENSTGAQKSVHVHC